MQHRCDAIDINLGCPQRVAFQGHYGSFLLDEIDRPLVLGMVRALRAGVSIPVFCKIRLLDTLEATVELCRQVRAGGVGGVVCRWCFAVGRFILPLSPLSHFSFLIPHFFSPSSSPPFPLPHTYSHTHKHTHTITCTHHHTPSHTITHTHPSSPRRARASSPSTPGTGST